MFAQKRRAAIDAAGRFRQFYWYAGHYHWVRSRLFEADAHVSRAEMLVSHDVVCVEYRAKRKTAGDHIVELLSGMQGRECFDDGFNIRRV